jgi:hypothetical protein
MSDVVDWKPTSPEGEKTTLDELKDKTIIITGFEERVSNFHDGENYLTVTAELEGRKIFFNTMAKAIVENLRKNRQLFAEGKKLRAKIVQRKGDRGVRYYAFDSPDA